MTPTLALIAAVLAAMCLFAVLWSRWPAWLKTMLVIAITGFYFLAYDAVLAVWGLPSRDALPERFVLLAAVIEEPTTKTPGALYVWLNAIEDGKPAAQPRAYRLAYAKDLHALINEAMKKSRQGVSQLGTTEPQRGRRGLFWLRPGNDEQEVKLRDAPVPQLPEK